jgi:hypothetical protein
MDRMRAARTYTSAPPYERLMAMVRREEGGCWIFTGGTKNGYAAVSSGGHNGHTIYGHRLMYEREHGPIPVGCQVHHRCENPRCVNPAHLEVLTVSEHRRQHGHGVGPCPACGAEDWYIRKDTGARMCRECKRIRRRKARE